MQEKKYVNCECLIWFKFATTKFVMVFRDQSQKMKEHNQDYFEMVTKLHENMTVVVILYIIKGYVQYIFAILVLSLKECTFKTRKNVFHFTSKALFILEMFKC